MKTNRLRLLALLLCLMLPLCACAETTAETPAEEPVELPNVVEVLNTYTTLDLTPYLGKTMVINFFTEWCGYCMMEMPEFREVNDLYDPEHFQMVLVHVWDGEDETSTQNVKDRYDMHHMTFFEDTDCLVAAVVGVPGFPSTLVLNPDGTLAAAQGSMLTFDALSAYLDAMGVERLAVE